MPNSRRQDRELDALYATLPKLDCKGLCADSCGPIECSVRERARAVERGHHPLECEHGGLCLMLDKNRRCTIYDARPLICRLWGLAEGMRCPYGCVPEGGLLPRVEARRLMAEADRIGGVPPDRAQRMIERVYDSLSDEQRATLVYGERFGRR